MPVPTRNISVRGGRQGLGHLRGHPGARLVPDHIRREDVEAAAQRQAILDAGLGVFVFTGSSLAQRTFREIASFVLGVTDTILDNARTTKRPFIWGISDRRVFARL